MRYKIRDIARGAMIAALYIAVTMLFAPISFGEVQLRVSESLTLLPFYMPEAVPALFVGCLIANFIGGLGLWDVIFGSGATLLAALLSSKMPNLWLAAVPPVIVNMFVIGTILHLIIDVPLLAAYLYVGLGQAAACYAVGIPLMKVLEKYSIISRRKH
ncbi:MAG: QueT transporter family protein [Synergistaceae bacterium]|nr:QueT transporter family protein [Synergistaceae bacterium]